MTAFTLPKSVADVVLAESNTGLSRETGLVAASQTFVIGQVLGKAVLGAATSAAKTGGNTGTGTMTLDATTPILANAKVGIYRVTFTAATTYVVLDPTGLQVGAGGVNGVAFANQIKFVTAAGGTPFIAGDAFDITIADGTGYLKAIDPTALDGSQVAYAVALDPVPASIASTTKIGVMARNAVVASGGLVWGTLNAAQQSAALRQFLAVGLRVRASI